MAVTTWLFLTETDTSDYQEKLPEFQSVWFGAGIYIYIVETFPFGVFKELILLARARHCCFELHSKAVLLTQHEANISAFHQNIHFIIVDFI